MKQFKRCDLHVVDMFLEIVYMFFHDLNVEAVLYTLAPWLSKVPVMLQGHKAVGQKRC